MKSGLAEYRRKLKAGEIEPSANRTPREKMEDNPNSLRAAITCFCWECMGESRKEVSECEGIVGQDKKCPLWRVRPWQKNQEDEE
jgi:hypothetical protein